MWEINSGKATSFFPSRWVVRAVRRFPKEHGNISWTHRFGGLRIYY
jgi:hypothetical protein